MPPRAGLEVGRGGPNATGAGPDLLTNLGRPTPNASVALCTKVQGSLAIAALKHDNFDLVITIGM